MPKKILIVCLVCSFCSHLFAQQRDYRAEFGILGGVAYYLGDANKTPMKNLTPNYGGLFRYRFDTRNSIRAEFTRSSVIIDEETFSIENPVLALDVCAEFNFFDLEKNSNKRFSKIFSPYIFAGIGAMTYSYEDNPAFSMSIPFGLGMKVKFGGRWNLNVQYSTRLLFKDNLEGLSQYNDPYQLNGSNFMNNDLLSTLTVGVTFDFWERSCDCHNERPKKKKY